MAYTYLWPTTGSFPQVPQKGFTESVGVNIIRSNMDAGPAKMRRRSNAPNTMNLSFILTTAQVSTLETWIKNDIKGVARFGFRHPRTQAIVEVRIVPSNGSELFQLKYLAPGYWETSFTFEVLPS
jgi:hypothetical protein